jgi:hypothetical protein
MKNSGWIKLHRKILENSFCLGGMNKLGFWVYLLLSASHKDQSFVLGNTKIQIKQGQLLTGRKALAKQAGVSEGTIELWLDVLEKNLQQIVQQKTNKYRIITILNWDKYQDNKQQNDNKMTTEYQQNDTYKNVKNVKNDNNIYTTGLEEFVSKFNQLFGKNYRATPGLRKMYQDRLKNFTHSEIMTAVDSLAKSKFHRGDNNRHWVADPSFLLRSDEQVDKWRATGDTLKPSVQTLASRIPDSNTN